MGAYVELDSLIALQFKARGFTLMHSQPVHSLLFGRRASHIRGRGLDFEELRNHSFVSIPKSGTGPPCWSSTSESTCSSEAVCQ